MGEISAEEETWLRLYLKERREKLRDAAGHKTKWSQQAVVDRVRELQREKKAMFAHVPGKLVESRSRPMGQWENPADYGRIESEANILAWCLVVDGRTPEEILDTRRPPRVQFASEEERLRWEKLPQKKREQAEYTLQKAFKELLEGLTESVKKSSRQLRKRRPKNSGQPSKD